MKLGILDYGMGNLHSLRKKIQINGHNSTIIEKPKSILSCDKIILPGVGHFGKAISNIHDLNFFDSLNEFVLVKKKPILGICLGMQLMTKKSEEGNVDGLGWFDAEVVRFNNKDPYKYKVPHIGWNKINISKLSNIMTNISANDEFYFVHSYHAISNSKDVLTTTNYESNFVSAIERENIFGVQYHPEKSHEAGQTLITNFIEL